MNYNNAQILAQLVKALEDAVIKMEKDFSKRDIEKFNESKSQVLNFQKQIAQLLEEKEDGSK